MQTYYIILLGYKDWMLLEVGQKQVCWLYAEVSIGSKSAEKLSNFSAAGLEPMPHTSMVLKVQYLNVRQLKLGTNM